MFQARWLSITVSFGILLFSVWLFDLCFVISQALEFILLSVFSVYLCIWSIVFLFYTKEENLRIKGLLMCPNTSLGTVC